MNDKQNYETFFITVILLLLNCTVDAQILNRQMLSSQGKSVVLANGTFVSQSIGQQTVFGTSRKPSLIVQQGFQQSVISKFNNVVPIEVITTIVYPSSVEQILNFKFSSEIKGPIEISILNLAGFLVYKENKFATGTILSIQSLGYIATGVYVVNLSTTNYKYTTKIIKN